MALEQMKPEQKDDVVKAMCDVVQSVFEAESKVANQGGTDLLRQMKATSDPEKREVIGNQYIRLVAEQVINDKTIMINSLC